MQQDIQAAVEEVLSIEREADALVERARVEARELGASAAQEAAQLRQRLVGDARMQAEASLAAAKEVAGREREQRLAEADRQIREMEEAAQGRVEAAVRFAAAQLLGEAPVGGSADPGATEADEK